MTLTNEWQYKKDLNKAIGNIPAINTPVIQQFTFNSTGNISITGVGFKPKLVQFNYCDNSSGMGSGTMTELYQFASDYNSKTSVQTQCIIIRNGSGTVIGRAEFVSLDNDGFTINVTVSTGVTITVNYTCL